MIKGPERFHTDRAFCFCGLVSGTEIGTLDFLENDLTADIFGPTGRTKGFMAKERIGGLITGSGTLSLSVYRKKILELVKQTQMPTIYPAATWTEAGGLMCWNFRGARLGVKPPNRGAERSS